MSLINEINSCEVCGHSQLESVLNLGSHPLCDDLVEIGDLRVCREHPIEILYCNRCQTAHQRFQVPKQDLFPKSYHYRSRFTADVLSGMSALVEATEAHLGTLRNKHVLDVGCNDGSLLDFFQKKGAKTIGIEPTDAYKDAMGKGHEIINGFFSPESAREIYHLYGSPDVITFTNVFAHIENLPELVESLKLLMSSSSLIVIENHYLGSVLELNQFDTFYHEHPRTYSLSSFHHIAKSLGVEVRAIEFPSRYGGNIRVFMGKPDSNENNSDANEVRDILKKEAQFGMRIKELQRWIERWRSATRVEIENLMKKNGKLSAKAFPGRAAILVKLLGLDSDLIDVVYEKPGSMKIGHYLPGTRIPIESDSELFLRMEKLDVILNLAWHIPTEIENYLKKNNFRGRVVHVIS
jgi:hypothetical protein